MNEVLRRLLFLPDQASTFARDVDRLHYFVIITTFIMSTAVGLTAIFFFVRYRRRSETQTTPHIEPALWMEALFVGTPLIFFTLWFFLGFREFVRQQTPPSDSMDVYVAGKKWMWKFAYPDGPNAINVLRVPAGRNVRLLMTSRDVIHSFYVPEFRIKQDVLPGRYTQTWFNATMPGRYQILCAEYCGAGHSIMRGEVIVLKPQEYEDWLAFQHRGLVATQDAQPTALDFAPPLGNMVDQGRRIAAEQGCLKCHTTDGTRHIGPTWLDLYHRRERLNDGSIIVADEAYLTESMMDPALKVVEGFQPVMPSFQGKLAGPEVAALVEYIKSLQSDAVRIGPSEGPAYAPIRGR
ncbi:MAG: cytochrome c oxidase subunit II [Deltaproteobacteria bacterium]|nr:MAG: cytochrome c oxidase subunit II [Deltaproteobacteria bacterium]